MNAKLAGAPAVPRDAATVVVVRETAGGPGIEVLLLQRAERGDHNSGAWVFPGGLVDPADRESADAFRHAAIRECFEESGILFAVDANGDFVSLHGERGAELAALRHQLKDGKVTLAGICRDHGLRLVPERLHFIGHWLTPAGRAKRFDTRFFLAIAPREQTAMHDAGETMDHVWIAAADALSASNARRLMTPTRAMLETVRPFTGTAALAEWAAAPRTVERVLPRLAVCASGVEPIQSGHPAYEEVGKLDPHGRCDVWSELRPGVAVRIGEHVIRETNAQGLNAYKVGSDAGGWKPVPAESVSLVAEDRIVIAPDRASVPPEMLQAVGWLAPREGFLVKL